MHWNCFQKKEKKENQQIKADKLGERKKRQFRNFFFFIFFSHIVPPPHQFKASYMLLKEYATFMLLSTFNVYIKINTNHECLKQRGDIGTTCLKSVITMYVHILFLLCFRRNSGFFNDVNVFVEVFKKKYAKIKSWHHLSTT